MNTDTHPQAVRQSDSHRPSRTKLSDAKLATRLAFFIAGFGIACWAPLVPYAQQRLNADSATLGTILLCLGLGAMVGMPLAGAFSARFGAKPAILAGAVGALIALPLVTLASSSLTLGAGLLFFGVSLGCIDVAANVHGVEVQQAAAAPLMSSFHGMYSIGALVGASGMTAVLALGSSPLASATIAAGVVAACTLLAAPRALPTTSSSGHGGFAIPKGAVIVLGLLALICFLAEGAMLDWSALLLTDFKNVEVSLSGSAYAVFALAMTLVRMVGDRLVTHLGERKLLLVGLPLTAVGVTVVAVSESLPLVYAGMALAGVAVGNVVPVLYTLAGKQRHMSPASAITAASSVGYLGTFVGPALIGYAAHYVGLANAFVAVAALVLVSVLAVRAATQGVHPAER